MRSRALGMVGALAPRFAATAFLALGLAGCAGAQAFAKDSLVFRKCADCHAPNPDGRLSRVEDMRTTPEEWTVIVDRMRRLHGMPLGKGDMDRLLKELTATQILTPEEQSKVAYLSLWHNSQQLEMPADEAEGKMFAACVRCHTAGKIFSYRMTAGAWSRLRDFHLYVVPSVVYQLREMHWIAEADAVLAHLAKVLPYDKAWSPPTARLEGTWRVFGHQPGRGAYRGEAKIADAGNAEYTLSGRLAYADGTSETFAGEATLYGGYALRTRTRNNGFDAHGAYLLAGDEMQGENHLPAPDFRTSSARWVRASSPSKVLRVLPAYLVRGERTTLTVEGVNLPDLVPRDVSFGGAAVRVAGARRISPDTLELQVVSQADRLVESKLTVKGLDAGTMVLAPRIDHIAITPAMGRARLSGGRNYPAEGVQFEAIAYARRGSGKQAVDVVLGPVPASFRLTEERTRPDDDDLRWLGAIRPNGTYLPVGDYASNPTRKYHAENSGLVKVVAEYRRGAHTYRAQARLAVTMPDYIARIR